jgi:tRNA threonylcarbamoyladenosine biosynthesis protein TsaB
MKVLGIDTSGYANAIGIVADGQVLTDLVFEARADSLQKIVANIDAALQKAELTLDDIQGFGVGLGPGSWTGIRVGVTVGKMLAFSTGKPICGVPTLEVLAHQAHHTSGMICHVIYAGTGETVYAALYRNHKGTINREGEYYVGDLQGLADMIKESAVLVGAEAQSYRALIAQTSESDIRLEAEEGAPRGATVALLAANRLALGESDDVLSLAPLYLKESTARALVSKYRIAQAGESSC